jgi:hypothetical protein
MARENGSVVAHATDDRTLATELHGRRDADDRAECRPQGGEVDSLCRDTQGGAGGRSLARKGLRDVHGILPGDGDRRPASARGPATGGTKATNCGLATFRDGASTGTTAGLEPGRSRSRRRAFRRRAAVAPDTYLQSRDVTTGAGRCRPLRTRYSCWSARSEAWTLRRITTVSWAGNEPLGKARHASCRRAAAPFGRDP